MGPRVWLSLGRSKDDTLGYPTLKVYFEANGEVTGSPKYDSGGCRLVWKRSDLNALVDVTSTTTLPSWFVHCAIGVLIKRLCPCWPIHYISYAHFKGVL